MRPSLVRQESDSLVIDGQLSGQYVIGCFRNVVMFYWLGNGTVGAVERLNQACERLCAGGVRGISALHLIHAGVGLPDAAVRDTLIAAMKRYADVTACLGIVMLGGGFWASAMQSAITGIHMIKPSGASQLRFARTPEELSAWFVANHAELTGDSLPEARFLDAARELRAVGDRALGSVGT